MATYLVTGIAGFIGSHLAQALIGQGHTVRGFDNLATGNLRNLADFQDKIDFIHADLRNARALQDSCAGVDGILHLAALPSVPRSISDPRASHETNLDGTFNVLEAARLNHVPRVVFAASSSAYGNQPGFPRTEAMTPHPIAPYPVQKVAAELYMQSYWQVYGLETVCLRYFNVFGPRQDPASPYSAVIAKFIQAMLRRQQPEIYGDGRQRRDFTFVDNVVHANLLALGAASSAVSGRVFNIASGVAHSLNETCTALNHMLGTATQPVYGPPRAGDVRDSLADISAAKAALGYVPRVAFEEGLMRTVQWYRSQQPAVAPE